MGPKLGDRSLVRNNMAGIRSETLDDSLQEDGGTSYAKMKPRILKKITANDSAIS